MKINSSHNTCLKIALYQLRWTSYSVRGGGMIHTHCLCGNNQSLPIDLSDNSQSNFQSHYWKKYKKFCERTSKSTDQINVRGGDLQTRIPLVLPNSWSLSDSTKANRRDEIDPMCMGLLIQSNIDGMANMGLGLRFPSHSISVGLGHLADYEQQCDDRRASIWILHFLPSILFIRWCYGGTTWSLLLADDLAAEQADRTLGCSLIRSEMSSERAPLLLMPSRSGGLSIRLLAHYFLFYFVTNVTWWI